jgi:ATP-dependent DNA helicase RecQ
MRDDDALQLLRRLTATADAAFRPGQVEAIEALVTRRAKVLVVQRTGWGKSAVYLIATHLLRLAGAGPTILISPLLALMRNQLLMADLVGVRAATINSDNQAEWAAIEDGVEAGRVDLLLISPERLNNERFATRVMPSLMRAVGLLVIDEAHCISEWGHDFRPDYRRFSRVVAMLPRGVPVLCTTATANDRVVADIVEQLGHGLEVIRGPLDRESLRLAVLDLPQPAERLAWLAREIPSLPGSGIVYCLTIGDTERLAGWLRSRGIDARAYTGDSDSDDRLEIERALLHNEVKVVVATSALGMGYDKPDLGFVVHYQSPGSPIAYYQQVGRAGRGLPSAHGILLCGSEDADIQDYFIRVAFPPRPQAEAVVALLEQAGRPLSLYEITAEVNVRRTRLEAMLKILEVEGAVEKVGSRYQRTLKPWSYPEERVARVTAARRAEQAAMRQYAATGECRMAFLRRLLDDDGAAACGRCDTCTGTRLVADLDPGAVAAAVGHLRAQSLVINPRKRWPYGLDEPSGKIPAHLVLQPGRALSVYGDGGWGSVVRACKYRGEPVPDELVGAAARLIAAWGPDPAPAWVDVVPSATSGPFLLDAAARLAAALGLPRLPVLRRARRGPPQKDMENSAQQVRNVYGAFVVDAAVPQGPVLLVDDIIDSGWTLTVAGQALLEAGAGPVFPFVLARATGD